MAICLENNAKRGYLASWLVTALFLLLISVAQDTRSQDESILYSVGIATVSVVGYTSFLLGPPIMGTLAEHFSLSSAFNLLLVFGLLICLSSRGLKIDLRDRVSNVINPPTNQNES